MSNRRFAAIAATLTACIFIMLVGIGLSARNRTVVAKKSPVTDVGFVPMAAETEMAPESKWDPTLLETMQKPGTKFVLDFATLTDNGRTTYKVFEDDSMPLSEGVLFSDPYDAKSGNLGFGIVERTSDKKSFLCIVDMGARGKGEMRFFLQYGQERTDRICLFSTN